MISLERHTETPVRPTIIVKQLCSSITPDLWFFTAAPGLSVFLPQHELIFISVYQRIYYYLAQPAGAAPSSLGPA